jgi:glycosyltransferase involved in cell wall biosynthesis
MSAELLPWVAVIGPSPQSRGGIARMIAQVTSADASDLRLVRVTSFRGGTSLAKGLSWIGGLSRFALLASLRRPALAYVHISSGASTFRKASFIAMARALGVPVLLHIHPASFFEQYGRPGAAGVLARWCVGASTATVVLADAFVAPVRLRHPSARVHVVPNGPDVDETAPVAANAPIRGRVLCLGSFVADKGIDVLVDAAALLANDLPDLRVVLAGSGQDETLLRARVLASGLQERVEFVGWVNGADRDAELSKASLFVLPSRTEGFPLALLEAMWQGVPCIATEVGAVPEILADGAGVTVPPEDPKALAAAMRSLLDGRVDAAAVGQAGARRVRERYAPSRQRRAILTLLALYAGAPSEPSG